MMFFKPNTKKDRAAKKRERDAARKDFAEFVVKADGHCQRCGQTEQLDAHHMLGKKFNSPRYGITLCRGCHNDLDKDVVGMVSLLEYHQMCNRRHFNYRGWQAALEALRRKKQFRESKFRGTV